MKCDHPGTCAYKCGTVVCDFCGEVLQEPDKEKVMSDRIEMGDRAKDKVSGLKGIVVIESNYLYSCRRLTIQPEETKDGKPADCSTFDEHQLELIKKGVVKPIEVMEKKETVRTGGYNPGPKAKVEPNKRK